MRDVTKQTPAQIEAAVTKAVAFLEYCQHSNLMLDGRGIPSFVDQVGMDDQFNHLYASDLSKLFEMARGGDIEADCALRVRILEDAQNGALTREKCSVLGWLLLAPRPEPRASRELKNRNFFIATAVCRTTALGFLPTRNKASYESVSACQVVARALTRLGLPMTENAVRAVWDDNKGAVEKIAFVPVK